MKIPIIIIIFMTAGGIVRGGSNVQYNLYNMNFLKSIELKNNQIIRIKLNSSEITEGVLTSKNKTLVNFKKDVERNEKYFTPPIFSFLITKSGMDSFQYSYRDNNGVFWECFYNKSGELIQKMAYKNGDLIGYLMKGVYHSFKFSKP